MNDQNENRTIIKDVDIPFGRLVVIILKVMLASIPAIIIFYAIFFGIVLLFAMLFGGGAALFNHLGGHALPNFQPSLPH